MCESRRPSSIYEAFREQLTSKAALQVYAWSCRWSNRNMRQLPLTQKARIRRCSSGVIPGLSAHSRSHCLTSRPRDATAKLSMRATNQRPFSHTELRSGGNGPVGSEDGTKVALANSELTAKLASCCEIWTRTCRLASDESRCSSL